MTPNGPSADASQSTGSEAGTGTGSRSDRRGVLRVVGAAVGVGLAGCSELGFGSEDDGTPAETATDGNGTATPTTADSNETDGTAATDDGEATPAETPGNVHEHGTLTLQVDGERHSFDREKYYDAGEFEDGEAEGVFHFHPDGNEDYWHMHRERLTLQEALASLPDVDYVSRDGTHVLDLEGETYVDGENGTEIEIREGDDAVDPTSYELQNGDSIRIEVRTGNGT